MFDTLPYHKKARYALNRKDWLTTCKQTDIARSTTGGLLYTLNSWTDGRQVGWPVLDTGGLPDGTSLPNNHLPLADFNVLGASDGTFYETPLDILFGIKVTDQDGLSNTALVHVQILADQEIESDLEEVNLEPLLTSRPIANQALVIRLDPQTRERLDGQPVDFIWSIDRDSNSFAMSGMPSTSGMLELPAAALDDSSAYTLTLTAVWPDSRSTSTWLNVTTADAPHGGTFATSRMNGTALFSTESWSVSCGLWTTSDPDLLPLQYSFLLDVGGNVGEVKRISLFSMCPNS